MASSAPITAGAAVPDVEIKINDLEDKINFSKLTGKNVLVLVPGACVFHFDSKCLTDCASSIFPCSHSSFPLPPPLDLAYPCPVRPTHAISRPTAGLVDDASQSAGRNARSPHFFAPGTRSLARCSRFLTHSFSPTCSSQVPSYVDQFSAFKSKGVDDIYVVSVNDMFVMNAWKAKLLGEGKDGPIKFGELRNAQT